MAILANRPAEVEAAPWYLTDGVLAADVVAAYQPKGAASLAASYSNLANPGTQDAVATVPPTWAAGDGWIFNGTDQYLKMAGLAFNADLTAIVRFSNFVDGSLYYCLFGKVLTDLALDRFDIQFTNPDGPSQEGWVGASQAAVYGNSPANGVYALAKSGLYLNGSVAASLADVVAFTASTDAYIGTMRIDAGETHAFDGYFPGKIQAFALYNKTLAAGQIAAISAAMAAL
jgi:hypothetical protein